jgi:uncharacterized protein (TIGR02145 family)
MKCSSQFWVSVLISSLISIPSLAQEENANAGMPVRDIDGNVYRVIMTESGVWMADNLKALSYNDGKPIPIIRDRKQWEKTKTPAFGFYSNDVKYTETYGAIYNWYAVSTGKICPKGWHVPTEEEWNDLMDYAGSSQKSGDNPAKLKEKGTAHWKAPNTGATNEIFFNALPAGEVSYFNTNAEPGTMTNWWTSTEDKLSIDPSTKKAANANIVGLKYNFNSKNLGTYQKESALPVRCKLDD